MRAVVLAVVVCGLGPAAMAHHARHPKAGHEIGPALLAQAAAAQPSPTQQAAAAVAQQFGWGVALASGPETPRGAAVEPDAPPGEVAKHLTIQAVEANQWWRFGGSWFRLWGGTFSGEQPKNTNVTPDGKNVYTANFGLHDHSNVWRFDPATLEVKAKANFPGNAIEMVTSSDSKTLYVSNFYHKEVLALDALTLEVKQRYTVQNVPKHFALSPDEKTLYISNWESASTSVVDVKTGDTKATIHVGDHPRGTAVTHDGKKLYVANFYSRDVSVIDTATLKVVGNVKSPCFGPRHIAITNDDTRVLVSCNGSHFVFVIDPAVDKVVRKVAVGKGPKTVVISKDQRFAYTADYHGNTLSIIDLATWSSLVVPVPTVKTCGLAVTSDDRRIYATGWDSRNLLVFERLAPGQTAGPVGPKAPSGVCRQNDPQICKTFP